MSLWHDQLRDRLDRLADESLLRSLRVTSAVADDPLRVERGGRTLINLAGNDYLAIAAHPSLKRAAAAAIERWGVGAGASRLVSGHQPPHEQLEQRFARFKLAEAALLTATGFTANLAVLTTLPRRGDLLCLDKLNHASLIDAARASDATLRTYPHVQLGKLDRLLSEHRAASPRANRFIVTDSVFSMDGDVADLPALCALAESHEAVLIVDEAHATGVLGATGAGLAEAQGVSDFIAERGVAIATASKALGALGGIITAKRIVIDTLINEARSFIYTTGIAPCLAAAIDAALDVLAVEPQRREHVRQLAAALHEALRRIDSLSTVTPAREWVTPIVPVIAGSSQRALALADHLCDAGFLAPAIRPPTVAKGAARVRVSLRADLEADHVQSLIEALRSFAG